MDVIIADLNAEFFLAEKDHISKLKGIYTKVICKLGLLCDLVSIYLKLINEKLLYLFEHNLPPVRIYLFYNIDIIR